MPTQWPAMRFAAPAPAHLRAHPADLLQVVYSHWFELPPTPEHALRAEERLRPIRLATTTDERAHAWRTFARMPLPSKGQA